MSNILQGTIFLADLEPATGHEQGGFRPVIIVSGDVLNKNLGLCIVCPLSSQKKFYTNCVIIKKDSTNMLDQDSEVLTHQIRAISQKRLIKKIGVISTDELELIFRGINDTLIY